MKCIRCGRNEDIENHHILESRFGGGNEPGNKEYRCRACHKYEHTRRRVLSALEYERSRGQKDRIAAYEHRLEVLDRLNIIELIRERGTYISYWSVNRTHRLPRRIPTKEEAEFDKRLDEDMAVFVAELTNER